MPAEDAKLLWAIVAAVVSTMAAIIAYFQKRHYADLDRKFEDLTADRRHQAEQIRELFLAIARGERIEQTVARLEREIAGLREDLYTRRPPAPNKRR